MTSNSRVDHEKKLTIGRDPHGAFVTLELEIRNEGPEKTTTGEVIVKRATDLQNITQYRELSIVGTSRNCGGQMQAIIRKELPEYKSLAVPRENILRILDIWDVWANNGMHSGTTRQDEALDKHYELHPDQKRDFTNNCRVLSAIPSGDYGVEFLAEVRKVPENLRGTFPGEGYHYLARTAKVPLYAATGEFREPIRGEYYLSGAEIVAYRAPNDLSTKYWIARPEGTFTLPESGEIWLSLPTPNNIFAETADAEVRAKQFTETTGKQTRVVPTGSLYVDHGYKYGSAWLVKPLPQEIEAEILQLFTSDAPAITAESETTDFAKKHGIEFTAEKVTSRPDGFGDGMARHFKCRIMKRGTTRGSRHMRSMSLYFSQGEAHTEPPTLNDVLECLSADFSGYENARSFEEWASELGYDSDSRKAEKSYRAVKRQAEQLKRTIGDEAYTAVLEQNYAG